MALFGCLVIVGDAKWNEDALHVAVTGVDGKDVGSLRVVGHLSKDMTLIVGVVEIAIDDSASIVQLETILETEAAAREQTEIPASVDLHADTGGDLHGLTGCDLEADG